MSTGLHRENPAFDAALKAAGALSGAGVVSEFGYAARRPYEQQPAGTGQPLEEAALAVAGAHGHAAHGEERLSASAINAAMAEILSEIAKLTDPEKRGEIQARAYQRLASVRTPGDLASFLSEIKDAIGKATEDASLERGTQQEDDRKAMLEKLWGEIKVLNDEIDKDLDILERGMTPEQRAQRKRDAQAVKEAEEAYERLKNRVPPPTEEELANAAKLRNQALQTRNEHQKATVTDVMARNPHDEDIQRAGKDAKPKIEKVGDKLEIAEGAVGFQLTPADLERKQIQAQANQSTTEKANSIDGSAVARSAVNADLAFMDVLSPPDGPPSNIRAATTTQAVQRRG